MSELVNYHPHSRYTLHEKAGLYPFRDLIWNKTDGPFIDLKVDYPDPTNNYADGTAYLRTEDVIEMAHVLGMATREEMDALQKENAELKEKLKRLPTMVESFKNELHRTTSDFLAALDATDSLALAYAEEPKNAEPDHTEDSAANSEQAKAAVKGLGTNHRGSVRSNDRASKGVRINSDAPIELDEPAAESSDEPVSSERPDDVPSVDGNEPDPLATFLGLGNPKE